MDKEELPLVNFKKESVKLSTIQRHFINKINKYNVDRVAELATDKRRCRYMGIGLGLFAFSIYFYTMNAVRQETFLDDFEVPKRYQSQ